MKSYWIAATVVLVIAWPFGSNAYVSGVDQAEQQTVQPASAPNSSASRDSVKVQASAATAPAAGTHAAVDTPAPTAAQTRSSYMLVELTKGLKAKKLKPGDKVKAEVSQDVVAHGKVIIPVETRLLGHVTEVSVRDAGNTESRLGIVFDRILLKHYRDINFQAVIQAVAPPMERRSRVDEPDQMLPPSMMGGGMRQSSSASSGRTVGNRGPSSPGPSNGPSLGDVGPMVQTPFTVKQSPSTNTQTGSAAAQLELAPGGKPLSVGMPQGVIGLKGLSLSAAATASTPGPVIVSNVGNVKLDSGTQILLRVMSVEIPQQAAKK